MNKKILIHLDTLLDYRLAAVSDVCPDALPKVLETYENRLYDDFQYEGCLQSDVDKLIDDPSNIYHVSPATAMAAFLSVRIAGIVKDAPHSTWEIMVNTYPLELPNETRTELSEVLSPILGMDVKVCLVPYHTYPSLLGDVDLLVCYDLKWTIDITESLKVTPYPNMMVFTARVLNVAAREAYNKGKGDAFSVIEYSYLPVFNLTFLPVGFYNTMTMSKLDDLLAQFDALTTTAPSDP